MNIYKRYWGKYKWLFLIAVTCVFFEAVCDLLQPTIMAHVVDDGVKNADMRRVLTLGALMLGVSFAGAGFALVRNYLSGRVSQSFGADLRSDLFRKITKLSLSAVDKMESGSLITRLTNDVTQVTQFVNGMMRIFFKAPLTCIGSIVLAVMLNARLSLVLFGVIALVGVFIVISMKLSYERFAKVQYAIDRVNTVVQEYLMGVRLVKAFGRFQKEEARFEGVNQDLAQKNVSAQRVAAVFSPLMSLSVNVGIAVVIYVGSRLFLTGSVQVGEVIAYTNYMTQILGSLMQITNIFNTFVRTKASNTRIQQVFDQPEEAEAGKPPARFAQESALVFDRVSFAYPGGSGRPALSDISFQLERGKTLAVIGPTGAGKSTLAWLLLRFYDVDRGSIRIGCVRLTDMAPEEVRRLVAIAPQQSMLFSGTVRENIRWGNRAAPEGRVAETARDACAEDFILKMPSGYDSVLGQSGVNLSGGQKQRLSIARALIKDAPLLVLDDCTSALDAVTEAAVRRNLQRGAQQGKTVILITQRIGTAMGADSILVLDDGNMVGFGEHSALMQNCETYRSIYESQIGGEEALHG